MVLVDSSAWIEALRRRGRIEVKLAFEGLLEAYEAQRCTPVRLGVLGGARAAERLQLSRYLSVVPYRRITDEDWERAIPLAWQLRDQGLTVPWLDVLVTTIALHDGQCVYAVDDHFRRISDLTGLALYEPGYGGAFRPA